MKCKRCDGNHGEIRSVKTAFGDGEPDQYEFYSSCYKCGTEIVHQNLSEEDQKKALVRSSFFTPGNSGHF